MVSHELSIDRDWVQDFNCILSQNCLFKAQKPWVQLVSIDKDV